MLIAQIIDANQKVIYAYLNDNENIDMYIKSKLQKYQAPFKYRSVPVHQMQANCQYIYFDKISFEYQKSNLGVLSYKAIKSLLERHTDLDENKIQNFILDVLQMKKCHLQSNNNEVLIIFNPF